MKKMAEISPAKAQTGRDTVKGVDENGLHRNKGSYKVTATGHEDDSGSTDESLSAARASLYGRAVANTGARKNADPALQDRQSVAAQIWKEKPGKSRKGAPKKGQLGEVAGKSTPKIDMSKAGFSRGDRKASRKMQLDAWAQGK